MTSIFSDELQPHGRESRVCRHGALSLCVGTIPPLVEFVLGWGNPLTQNALNASCMYWEYHLFWTKRIWYVWTAALCRYCNTGSPCRRVTANTDVIYVRLGTKVRRMTSGVLCSIVARDFPTKRLSETTKLCRKRQSACRKRQSLVGNDKALSAILSLT